MDILAQAEKLLMDENIGTDGGTTYDDAALEIALDLTMDLIHMKLDFRTTKVTESPIANVLRTIQKDLIFMMILQAKHVNQNNLVDAGAVVSFWQITPALTNEHKALLKDVKVHLRTTNIAKVFDVHTGIERSTRYYGGYYY